MSTLLEIACFSPNGALLANAENCDRLELCSSYSDGGLTPSRAYLQHIRRRTEKSLFVMIRPEGGHRPPHKVHIDVMIDDILFCKEQGMNGIVLGALKADHTIDEGSIEKFVEAAAPLPVTFHRAFDLCPEPFLAMEALINCGVKRILTSGGKKTAEEGMEVIAALNRKANGRIIIIPGGGVRPSNVRTIVQHTGCTEIHSAALPPSIRPSDEIVPDRICIQQLIKELTLS